MTKQDQKQAIQMELSMNGSATKHYSNYLHHLRNKLILKKYLNKDDILHLVYLLDNKIKLAELASKKLEQAIQNTEVDYEN